jgi:hypothetical protein
MKLTEQEFSQIKTQLDGMCRDKLTNAQADAYYHLWSIFPLPVITMALTEWTRDTSVRDRFPLAADIVRRADRIWAGQIERDHAEHRAQERLGWQQIEDKTKDDVGCVALALIKMYLAEKIEKAAYVEGLRTLHRRWPVLGFDRSADEVEALGH